MTDQLSTVILSTAHVLTVVVGTNGGGCQSIKESSESQNLMNIATYVVTL